MRHIISILMQNEAGALARVVALFSSRGYNIESLSVAPTEDSEVSRRLSALPPGSANASSIVLPYFSVITFHPVMRNMRSMR